MGFLEVAEGQFSQVMREEVATIKDVCSKLDKGNYAPAITFVVIQVRLRSDCPLHYESS